MLDYEYTEINRLDNPHKYMYTSYQGSAFLDSYFRDRLKNLKICKQMQEQRYNNRVDLSLYSRASFALKSILNIEFSDKLDESLESIIDWDSTIKSDNSLADNVDANVVVLSSFNIDNEINSESLLESLLNCQLNKCDDSLVKIWIDRLVQRFEVTKKLYESYPKNFRKGKGRSDVIRLYWLFALSLALFYCVTKNIKYLSTLLKVTDLLCSLDIELLSQNILPQGLSLVLLVELLSVKLLSKTVKEVNFDFT